jgi:hypothetical protein
VNDIAPFSHSPVFRFDLHPYSSIPLWARLSVFMKNCFHVCIQRLPTRTGILPFRGDELVIVKFDGVVVHGMKLIICDSKTLK